jgi:hypothetical protein
MKMKYSIVTKLMQKSKVVIQPVIYHTTRILNPKNATVITMTFPDRLSPKKENDRPVEISIAIL